MIGNAGRQLALPDGRRLGFAEFGDSRGRPFFYFHGFPGSRIEALLGHEAALRQNLRLIAVDRPGYGLSDYQQDRTLLGWPDDVAALADHLGLERFAVIGASGGGPYALACAYRLGPRLSAAAVLCGLGPLNGPKALDGMMLRNRYGLFLSVRAPMFARGLMTVASTAVSRWPDWFAKRFALRLPEPDRSVLFAPEMSSTLAETLREAFRQGPQGAAWDLTIYSRPWGFQLDQIAAPVRVWQGERDIVVPPGMARHQEQAIPNCTARFYPEDGHFSLIKNRIPEILAELAREDS